MKKQYYINAIIDIIKWIEPVPTERTQHVRVNKSLSLPYHSQHERTPRERLFYSLCIQATEGLTEYEGTSIYFNQLGRLVFAQKLQTYLEKVFCHCTPTYSHDHPAKQLPKRPVNQRQLQGNKWQAHHAEHIGNCQVQDVDVGHRLHLGIAQDYVYDQGVSTQAHGANHEIDEGDDHRAGLVLMSLPAVSDVQIQIAFISQHEAVIQEVLGEGEVGLSRRKGPLIQGHDVS